MMSASMHNYSEKREEEEEEEGKRRKRERKERSMFDFRVRPLAGVPYKSMLHTSVKTPDT